MNLLTPQELWELTHRKTSPAQKKALNSMGIDYRVRPDGTVAVLKSHLEKAMGGVQSSSQPARKEPNWGAMRA